MIQTPVIREYYETWSIHTYLKERGEHEGYLSPSRREYYMIALFSRGMGEFTLGQRSYSIQEPTLLFINPGDIISWKGTSQYSEGYYCLFNDELVKEQAALKEAIDWHKRFGDGDSRLIRLSQDEAADMKTHFIRMRQEEQIGTMLREETMSAYLQQIITDSCTAGDYLESGEVKQDYLNIYRFFELLEKEAATITLNNPLHLRHVGEFAERLSMPAATLNTLLKKNTGEIVSEHIRNRLMDECKAFLLRTDWNLETIAFRLGFTEQANFNSYFKKNSGLTPAAFRKRYQYQQ